MNALVNDGSFSTGRCSTLSLSAIPIFFRLLQKRPVRSCYFNRN